MATPFDDGVDHGYTGIEIKAELVAQADAFREERDVFDFHDSLHVGPIAKTLQQRCPNTFRTPAVPRVTVKRQTDFERFPGFHLGPQIPPFSIQAVHSSDVFGRAAYHSSGVLAPLERLQFGQAGARLLSEPSPPLDLGMMWSLWNLPGAVFSPQYVQ